jgi:hypothetical protein
MVWLSGLVPYGKGHQVFERIGHREIPRWSLWAQTQQHGKRLKAYVDHQQEHVGMERVALPPPGQDHGQRKGVGIGGGMVHIRGEGWKEVKVGTVFDIDLRLERDRHTHDLVERPHAAHIAYTAILGSVDDFAPAMWALAWHHGVATAADSSVTADGAEWIWRLVADLFPDSVQIVDWFHACEHLAGAAQALHPDDGKAAKRWFRKRCKDLYKGEIHKITLRLDTAGLPKHSHYFHTYKRKDELPSLSGGWLPDWLGHGREQREAIQRTLDRCWHALVPNCRRTNAGRPRRCHGRGLRLAVGRSLTAPNYKRTSR